MNSVLNFSESVLTISALISVVAIAISLVLLLYRIIAGPTSADRAVALDAVGMSMMGLTALIAIIIPTTTLNDVVLVIGILLFIGTIGIAKYLEKGVIIDRDLD
ncbi:Na(+)/H(+) antiporter subunit F1 [Barrientosiimonas marina]|uniref:Monovalent cation/H+ antiporter complex subunit F n=1 Tax=Lentibacillus kimchii TaxID=1542911 RepID=A0ABW2UZP4_9BACI